jgi:predicted dehydrogenase
MSERKLRTAVIGVGGVSQLQYFPGVQCDPRAELVAICDPNPELLDQRQREWGVRDVYVDYVELLDQVDLDAVIVATPNCLHRPIVTAAVQRGRHVLCEKPLGLNADEVRAMYSAARDAGVIHMTAFTYRFPPAMRYLRELVRSGSLGDPRHFRSQRFLDLPETSWGWRQCRDQAGAGDLYDMTIHRIDFAQDLLGPIDRVCGAVAQFAPRTRTADGGECAPSEVDDWSALMGYFRCGAVGVWEGTTLAKGYHLRGIGHEWAEINGSEATAVYRLHEPNEILLGRHKGDLEAVPVPARFLKPAGSPRSLEEPDRSIVFRYDLAWEFHSAILEGRSAVPSFYDGLRAQIVADAVLRSSDGAGWVDIPEESAA